MIISTGLMSHLDLILFGGTLWKRKPNKKPNQQTPQSTKMCFFFLPSPASCPAPMLSTQPWCSQAKLPPFLHESIQWPSAHVIKLNIHQNTLMRAAHLPWSSDQLHGQLSHFQRDGGQWAAKSSWCTYAAPGGSGGAGTAKDAAKLKKKKKGRGRRSLVHIDLRIN